MDENRPLEIALLKVQQKHIKWFEKRPPLFEGQPHDLLENHWTTNFSGEFGFNSDSDLPEYIKKDCVQEVKEI
jgi:hypothetical protein